MPTSISPTQSRHQEIRVQVGDQEDRRWIETFRGSWLIEPDVDNRFGADTGACYGIASTANGQIAVYCFHVNDLFAPSLTVYQDIEDAMASEPWVEEFEAAILSAAGVDVVIRRDI